MEKFESSILSFECCCSRTFTGLLPFLSPNQQHQSTEGWQCSWLETACCRHVAKIGQGHYDGSVGCLDILSWVHPYCDKNGVPDLETACCHHADMVSQEYSCGSRSIFTGRMPFLLPNQQCQITDGTLHIMKYYVNNLECKFWPLYSY